MTAEQSRRQFLRSTAGAGFGVAALVGEAQGSKFAALDRGATGSLDACQAADRAIGVLVANGFDDVFPRLFEIDLLAGDPLLRETLCADAVRYLLADRATSRPPFRSTKISWPKNDRQGFRRCALLDPRDAVIYLTAAILIAQAIEPHRLPIATNTVFSYRFTNTQGTLFNSSYNAEAFHAETLARLATDRRIHLVRTDIESFYPQIAHERLRSILRRCAVEQDCIDVVLRLLRAWQDADGRGIPIGQDASRILGEASLIEVDRALVAAGVDFTRFVDDYRLFAPDAATAHGWLDILTRSLAREQLTLNAAKTALDAVTRSEYATLSARRKLGPASLSGAFEQRAPACPPSGCRRPSKPKDSTTATTRPESDSHPRPSLSSSSTRTPTSNTTIAVRVTAISGSIGGHEMLSVAISRAGFILG